MFSKKVLFLVWGALLLIQLAPEINAKAVSSEESDESHESDEDVKEQYPEALVKAAREYGDHLVSGVKSLVKNVIVEVSNVEDKPEELQKAIENLNKYLTSVEEYEKKSDRRMSDARALTEELTALKDKAALNQNSITYTLLSLAFQKSRMLIFNKNFADKSNELVVKIREEYRRYKGPSNKVEENKMAELVHWVKEVKGGHE